MMSYPTSLLLLLLTGALCSTVERSNASASNDKILSSDYNLLDLLKTTVDCTSISDKQELEKAVAEIGDWETICENLGVPNSVINGLRYSNKQATRKKSDCLEAYLDTDEACWQKVVMVVAEHPFSNRRLAKRIANTYYGKDYSSIMKEGDNQFGMNHPTVQLTVQPTVQPEPTSINKPTVSETQSQPTITPQKNVSPTHGKPLPENTDDRSTSLITLTMVVGLVIVVFILFGIRIQKLWTDNACPAHKQPGVSEPTNMHKETRRIVPDSDDHATESLPPPCPVNVDVESGARSFLVKWEQPRNDDRRIVHRVQYKLESDGWPENSQDKRWKNVEAGRYKIEIPELLPNRKYVVKVLAKYASAEDTIENWSKKEVTQETRKTFFQWKPENQLALAGLVVGVVGTIIIPLVLHLTMH